MDSLLRYINEAGASTKWAAIRITTSADSYHNKDNTSERVVTWDTYAEMKSKGSTKGGYMTIKSLELLGTGNSREAAEEYLTPKDIKKRKSKIKTDGYDLICWAITCGKMQQNGKTKFGWSLWDSAENDDQYIFVTSTGPEFYLSRGSFIFAAKDTFKQGDKVLGVDNDTEKKLSGFTDTIVDYCHCDIESFREMIRRIDPRDCKRPQKAFGKVSDGLPWNRFGQVYSCKGTIKTDKYNEM